MNKISSKHPDVNLIRKRPESPPAPSLQPPAPSAPLKQSHIKFPAKGKHPSRLVETPPQEEEKKGDSTTSSKDATRH